MESMTGVAKMTTRARNKPAAIGQGADTVLIDKACLDSAIERARSRGIKFSLNIVGDAAGFGCERTWHRFRSNPRPMERRRAERLAAALGCAIGDLIPDDDILGGPPSTPFDEVSRAWPLPLVHEAKVMELTKWLAQTTLVELETLNNDVVASCDAKLLAEIYSTLKVVGNSPADMGTRAKELIRLYHDLHSVGFMVICGRYIKRRARCPDDNVDWCDALRCIYIAIRRESDLSFTIDRRGEPQCVSLYEESCFADEGALYFTEWEGRLPMLW